MTISEQLNKAGNAVMKTAKQKAVIAIANEKARNKAKKIAWKDMGDGKRARNIESYGGHTPAIIWVIGGKVYVTDAYKTDVTEVTGDDAEKFMSSSEGAAAIAKQSRSGSVSPMDAQMPDYLAGAPRGKAQTYEDWMGFK